MAGKKLTPAEAAAIEAQRKRIMGTKANTGQGSGNKPTTKPKTTRTPSGPTATVTQTPAETMPPQYANWQDAAKELYGGYYAIVESVPELQGLLQRAYNEKWSDAKFDYELRQTGWWKQNSNTAREWDLSSQTDPASAERLISARVSEMQATALSEYQARLSESQLRKLATDSLRGGWTDQMIRNAIGLEATRTGMGMSEISSGYIGQGLKQTANEYGLTLSNDMFNKWVADIATGKETRETFQQYAVNTAKTLFPAIADQLDVGRTFKQVTDPYKNAAADILEMNPDQINFLDPKWTRAVSMIDNGKQRMMNFNEWADYLRQERSFGYEYTSQAQSRAYQVANELANLFGKV